MASSIHIQKSISGSVGHNSREHFSYSVVFPNEKNEFDNLQKEAYKIYRSELKERSKKYTESTGQKLQKRAVTQLSAVVNLEQHHTLKDLQPLKEKLEEKFDTKVYQMAIHRDEGKLISKEDGTELYSGKDFFMNPKNNELYFDKKFSKKIDMNDYEIKKNYHAHIEMMGLNSEGKAIRQKMSKGALQEMQDFTAETLQMERGKKTKSYTKEQMKEILEVVGKKTDYESTTLYGQKFNEVAKELGYYHEKRKRKDTHQFKNDGAERESAKREQLAKAKDIKEENTLLRVELKKVEAVRDDYARLEKFNKDLKERLKSKEFTVEELKQEVQKYKDKYISKKVDYKFLQDDLDSSKKLVNELKSKNKALEKEFAIKDEKMNFRASNSDLKVEMQELIEQELEVKLKLNNKPKQFSIKGLVIYLVNKVKNLSNKVSELIADNQKLKDQLTSICNKQERTEFKAAELSKAKQVDKWWNKKMEEPIKKSDLEKKENNHKPFRAK